MVDLNRSRTAEIRTICCIGVAKELSEDALGLLELLRGEYPNCPRQS